MGEDGSNLGRLYRWQTLVAALVALVGAIAAALIAAPGGGGPPKPEPTGSPSSVDHSSSSGGKPIAPEMLSLSFTSWTEKSSAPPAKEFDFFGRVTGLPRLWGLYVVAANPDAGGPQPSAVSSSTAQKSSWLRAAPAPESWLVSPMAEVGEGGQWHVHWHMDSPPEQAKWIAVVFDNGHEDDGRSTTPPTGGPETRAPQVTPSETRSIPVGPASPARPGKPKPTEAPSTGPSPDRQAPSATRTAQPSKAPTTGAPPARQELRERGPYAGGAKATATPQASAG